MAEVRAGTSDRGLAAAAPYVLCYLCEASWSTTEQRGWREEDRIWLMARPSSEDRLSRRQWCGRSHRELL